MRLFAFLLVLTVLHFLKSIFYLQVYPMLICLVVYVALQRRNTGGVKRVRGKKGCF